MDVERASHLAQEGLALWESRKLIEAAERYKEALTHADPGHYATPAYHQQLAGVLVALGNDDDALAHFQKALELERNQRGDEAAVTVAVARYFLAEHYAKMSQPSAGLETIMPALAAGGSAGALLRMVQAECLWQLGRANEARAAAQEAIDGATSVDQRGRIEKRLAVVVGKGACQKSPIDGRDLG